MDHDSRRRTRRRRLLLACFALGTSVAGCSSTQSSVPDPYAGMSTIQAVPPAPGAPNAAPAPDAQTQGAVPPIPTSLSATNNATLASNPGLNGARPLALDNSVPGQLATLSKSGTPPPSAAPRVIPVPADTGPAPTPPATPSNVRPAASWAGQATPLTDDHTTAAASAPASPDDLFRKQLADRGYSLQHLKQDGLPQGIRLTCYAVRGNSPDQEVFETTAPDFASATQAILREADRRTATK